MSTRTELKTILFNTSPICYTAICRGFNSNFFL